MENSQAVVVTWNLRENNHFHTTNATLLNYKNFHTNIRSHNTNRLSFQWVQRLLHQLTMLLTAAEFMAKLSFESLFTRTTR
jgi:hypothetical protein